MSYTSLEGILNSVIEHQSVKHMFPYTITFVHPGGIRHGENALNMRRAMLFLDAHEGPITFDILKSLNISLVFNHVYLPTHHPEWIASGYRAESEVYYYPKCPRGYPVHKLHHFVFQVILLLNLFKEHRETKTRLPNTTGSSHQIMKTMDLFHGSIYWKEVKSLKPTRRPFSEL